MTHRIPRILHQTWKTAEVPGEWAGSAASWRTHHPEWQHRLWTDEDNRAFVAEHYPALLEAYDAYPYAIMRADAVRYCLLHHFGGVYVDLDFECLRPIDELIATEHFVVAREPAAQSAWLGTTSLVSNAFMAAPPGHPLLQAVLDELRQGPREAVTHVDVLEMTGPMMLQRVF